MLGSGLLRNHERGEEGGWQHRRGKDCRETKQLVLDQLLQKTGFLGAYRIFASS